MEGLFAVLGFAWQAGVGALIGLAVAWAACSYSALGDSCGSFGGWLVGGGFAVGLVFAIVRGVDEKR